MRGTKYGLAPLPSPRVPTHPHEPRDPRGRAAPCPRAAVGLVLGASSPLRPGSRNAPRAPEGGSGRTVPPRPPYERGTGRERRNPRPDGRGPALPRVSGPERAAAAGPQRHLAARRDTATRGTERRPASPAASGWAPRAHGPSTAPSTAPPPLRPGQRSARRRHPLTAKRKGGTNKNRRFAPAPSAPTAAGLEPAIF